MFVRLGLETDEDAVIELGRMNCAISTPHLEYDEAIARETYRAYIETCETTFFVVEDKREVIAFLMATMSSYRHASGLYTTQEVLFVRPDKHGTRAAVILVKELIRWSKMLGAKEITGGNDNKFKSERTARFLAHFGFEQVGFFMRRNMADGQEKRR